MVFQWFPMVADHWSDDGMVTIHRSGLDGVGSLYEIRDNPLSNPDQTQKQCFAQNVIVAAIVDTNNWVSTQHFKLDPMKCFNSDAELELYEGDNKALIALCCYSCN